MPEGPYPPVAELLPHAGRMVFLTDVVEHDENGTACVAEIGEDAPFRGAGGLVPAWVGIEYMAQCIAAHGGLKARAEGRHVKVGFFVGSRRIDIYTAGFSPGQVLEVRAGHVMGTSGFFAFACSVRDKASGALLMEGHLNVFLSDDLRPVGQEPSE